MLQTKQEDRDTCSWQDTCQLDQSSASNARLMLSQLSLCLPLSMSLWLSVCMLIGPAASHKDSRSLLQFVNRVIESPDAMRLGHLADPSHPAAIDRHKPRTTKHPSAMQRFCSLLYATFISRLYISAAAFQSARFISGGNFNVNDRGDHSKGLSPGVS